MHSFHITCRNSEVTARSADSVELSRARGILTRIEEIAREANLLSESFHQLSSVQASDVFDKAFDLFCAELYPAGLKRKADVSIGTLYNRKSKQSKNTVS